ncbi:hypothetical protein B488_04740 [Liberibacter crescens BT-1]|uniref:Uncharacterized protein n=1 Tax=Liberibacter crescens (strain BT-1) TaxID=1215343 RepID=L0EVP7_LIBCB|nr:hypothetical protein [Liberibacter crescens]AGA64466.1 hypothetical protein B488_04740 [Liberibacter crescens BT-1]AMC12638.1 hypothetical protein RL73_02490 [Liberibacter crescens]
MAESKTAAKEYIHESLKHLEKKLVLVEWEDSCQPISDWVLFSEKMGIDVAEVKSVGWLLKYTERTVVLVPNVGNSKKDNAQGSGVIHIPMSAVIKVSAIADKEASYCDL